jgi:SAM-dependent methyltransferase
MSQISAGFETKIAYRPSLRRRIKKRFGDTWRYVATFFRNLRYVLGRSYLDFFRVQGVITLICYVRYVWLALIWRRIRFFELPNQSNDTVAENTVSHNYKGLQLNALRAFSGERPNLLLRIVSVVESVSPKDDSILFVGPRAESELWLARGYGFRKQCIRGLDLISYTRQVDLGDMHAMPYEDNRWDVIVMGWVLAYSESPKKACEEVVRVARNGAVVAIGVQYHPLSPEQIGKSLGYIPGAKRRLESVQEVLSLFGSHVGQVYFRHDIPEHRRDQAGSIVVVFEIKKR